MMKLLMLNVSLSEWNLKRIEFQFGKVNGNFNCNRLISLKECPKYVGFDISCISSVIQFI